MSVYVKNSNKTSGLIFTYFALGELVTLLFACEKLSINREIKIETDSIVSNITSTSADVKGEILDIGESEIINYGHCWAIHENPTVIDDDTTNLGSRTSRGVFARQLKRLQPNTDYYVRAYAIDEQDTVYGNLVSFNTDYLQGTFTDSRDAQKYNWVWIGNQKWMMENLAFLPAVSPPTSKSNTDNYYYVYDYYFSNSSEAKAKANYSTYGVLYNWPAAMNGDTSSIANPSGVQGICPDGWHLPSDAEWQQLVDFISSDGNYGNEGTALKAASGWNSGGGGTDNYGFSALPGGCRHYESFFAEIGSYGNWWSATKGGAVLAYTRYLFNGDTKVGRKFNNFEVGYSVRCVRDN